MTFNEEGINGLEARLVTIDKHTKFTSTFNSEKKQYDGKLFILSQFALSVDTWELSKTVKSILERYLSAKGGSGWYLEKSNATKVLSYEESKKEAIEGYDLTELHQFYIDNSDLDYTYAYLVYFEYTLGNTLVLKHENELLKKENKVLGKKIDSLIAEISKSEKDNNKLDTLLTLSLSNIFEKDKEAEYKKKMMLADKLEYISNEDLELLKEAISIVINKRLAEDPNNFKM